jgi:FixJ family two-component response regulator
MPGMSGWELSRLIRARNAGVPLAVITGWGDVVGSDEQEAASIDWVVTKPFSMQRITDIIEEIKRRKVETRESELTNVAA